jgi:hypothetical protein
MSSCARCDQVINEEHDSNTIEWNDREYDEKCFKCFNCQKSLKNKMVYPNKTTDEFFCSICIKTQNKNDKLSYRCFRCKKKLLPNTHYTEFNEKYYHDLCFTCSSCKKSILHETFYPNNNHLLCEICYEMILEKCELCEKTINKGDIIIFQDKTYHDTCMTCAKCKGGIGGKMCFTKNKDGTFMCRLCDENEK